MFLTEIPLQKFLLVMNDPPGKTNSWSRENSIEIEFDCYHATRIDDPVATTVPPTTPVEADSQQPVEEEEHKLDIEQQETQPMIQSASTQKEKPPKDVNIMQHTGTDSKHNDTITIDVNAAKSRPQRPKTRDSDDITAIKDEQCSCLITGYIKDTSMTDNVYTDITETIQQYHGSLKVHIGSVISEEEYFTSTIHIDDCITEIENKRDQEKFVQTMTSQFNHDVGCPRCCSGFCLLLTIAFLIIAIICSEIENGLDYANGIMIFSACHGGISLIATVLFFYWYYQAKQHQAYSILKFNYHENRIQEWKLRPMEMEYYGAIYLGSKARFCQIFDIRNISSFNGLTGFKYCKPYLRKKSNKDQYTQIDGTLKVKTYDGEKDLVVKFNAADKKNMKQRVMSVMNEIEDQWFEKMHWSTFKQ